MAEPEEIVYAEAGLRVFGLEQEGVLISCHLGLDYKMGFIVCSVISLERGIVKRDLTSLPTCLSIILGFSWWFRVSKKKG